MLRRTYMDVNTRPSHSQMFNKNGRCIIPPSKPVVQMYSNVFSKVFGGCTSVAVALYMFLPSSSNVQEETEPSCNDRN
jgi:hypothetical protein